jgi:transposase
VVLRMLADVRQATIEPIIAAAVARGTLVHTDEYDIHARPEEWGYGHEAVCHGRGGHAREEDGDGSCGVHANTMAGVWSPRRSWPRPHRGVRRRSRRSPSPPSGSCTTPAAAAGPSSASSSPPC